MLRIVCAILAIVALAAAPALAQCNSSNGQCGAPNVNSLSAQSQLLQAQLNGGVAASSSSATSAVPAGIFAPAPAQQLVYQQYAAPTFAAAPAFAYGAYAGAVHPSQIVIAMPAMAAAPAAASAATAENVAAAPVQQVSPLYQFATFQAPLAASAGGASAAASASSSVPAAAFAPVPVNPGLASAASIGGCASGSCSARAGGGLLSRLGAALRPARRSSSRSVSISRSRVR